MAADLDKLHPFCRAKARELIRLAGLQGVRLLCTQGYRSIEEQDAYFAKGRDAAGNVIDESARVTNARGGESPHNYGLAFDVIPLDPKGEPMWKTTSMATWHFLYKLAEKVGLDALGDPWGEFVSWDPGHCQEPGWRLLKGPSMDWLRQQGGA